MKPLLRTGLALLALLLCNCEGLRCSQDGSRFPLDPTSVLNDSDLLGDADGTDAQGNSVNWEPAPANLRDRLKTPSGYRASRSLNVGHGIVYRQFEQGKANPSDPRYTLRALLITSPAFKQLQVLFSDTYDRPLYTQTVLERPGVMGLMSWCFFGRIPAGDMIGERCSGRGASCKPGIYHLAEKRTGKNIDLRYTAALNHYGQWRFFRGGLGADSRKWYRLAMGGGVLLFDQSQTPELYKAVGTSRYEGLYTSSRYNHTDIVSSGQAGYPKRAAPRSALGLLADGSLVFVNLGEGKYRFDGGSTPARLALLMKQLGTVKAIMFDGGGAPQMIFRNAQGRQLVRTYPELSRSSNYQYNYAFLTLMRP